MEIVDVPARKRNRLLNFDYSSPYAYFITICTEQKTKLFWENVGAIIDRPQDVRLSHCGMIVKATIENIPRYYPAIVIDHFVVMPNHVHLLLRINTGNNGRPMVAPTISTVIQQMKGAVTKQTGKKIWQKSFHDHVVRGEQDYQKIWNYIDGNPMKWAEDCFYIA